MLMNIKERQLLLKILPTRGDIRTLKAIRNLKEDLYVTQKELEATKSVNSKMELQMSDNVKDIYISEEVRRSISQTLGWMSEREELTEDMLSIVDMFL